MKNWLVIERMHWCDVMVDWPAIDGEPAGSDFSKKIFVVNDFLQEYASLDVKWRIVNLAGAVLAEDSLSCAVPENSLNEVGEVSWRMPDQTGERFKIETELLKGSEVLASNEYELKVRAR